MINFLQSIKIFSPYFEIRFLNHDFFHYKYVHVESLNSPAVAPYAIEPSQWYRQKVLPAVEMYAHHERLKRETIQAALQQSDKLSSDEETGESSHEQTQEQTLADALRDAFSVADRPPLNMKRRAARKTGEKPLAPGT
jgi:hypothetical protein